MDLYSPRSHILPIKISSYEAKDNLIVRLTLQKESSVIVSQSTFVCILKSDSK